MTPEQLTFIRTSDWSLTSDCGRYEVKRQPAYIGHDYLPKCLADPTRVIGEGRYPNSGAARAACQIDFEQQQSISNTKG